jgi:hypothetical protein
LNDSSDDTRSRGLLEIRDESTYLYFAREQAQQSIAEHSIKMALTA